MTERTGTDHTDVLIVGAGPTGLTAATRLAQHGVGHVVLDAAPAATTTSKASLVHASTIELLAELGIGDDLVAAGRVLRRIVLVDRGRSLLTVGLDRLATRYPFALGVPQSDTEALLLRRHTDLGGTVRRRHRVESVAVDGDRHVVTGTAETAAGPAPFTITARYLIGADGAHSVVRSALGLGFPGETYAEQFALADVRLDSTAGPDDQATINLAPGGVTVIGRLPSGNHRIVATVDAATEVPAEPDRRFVDALLRERGIAARCADEPAWSSRFRVHHRVADRFRVGGAFLAGDAAHVHSPAAGQGMNTGIADAYDLATRIVAVCTGQADEATLDGYERTRRAAALEVLRFTDRMTRMATLTGPLPRTARRVAMATVARLAPVQRRITTWISGLQRSPLRGDLPTLRTAQSRSRS
jgi:2-polyprenyl-6-methoxyphenol hydroxylase-like FAD-dependent oxidoreductase